MAKLNLNFCERKERCEPTQNDIYQLEGLALSIEAIIKTLDAYANEDKEDTSSVCMSVCNALELLIDPIVVYLGNYAKATPEEKTA